MARGFSDTEMVDGFLQGNSNAVEMVKQYIEKPLATWRGKFGFQIDDIRSDVMYKLYLSLKQGQYEFASSLETFVNRIVNHTCIDYYRYSRRTKALDISELSLLDNVLTQEERLEQKQTIRLSFQVFRLISKECRQLWLMVLRKDMTCKEIGETLGKSEGNIRRRLWVCREKAKEIRENLLGKDKHLQF